MLKEKFGSAASLGPVMCACGKRMRSVGPRAKRLRTILGEIVFERPVFVCPACGARRSLADEMLGVEGRGFSPGLCRLMARAGQRDTFKEGRDDLRVFAEIAVTAKDVERVAEGAGEEVEAWQERERAQIEAGEKTVQSEEAPILYVCYDGTGVPMVPWETEGRKGKQPDGSSRTREAKLGCVFTQTTVSEKGYPVRDEASTTFVGAIESSGAFGQRIYHEALRRGLNAAQKTVVLADGAKYNWEIAALHFPRATEIVDLFHARGHLSQLCALLIPDDTQEKNILKERWEKMLDEGRLQSILTQACELMPRNGKRRNFILKELAYFQNNASRMRYDDFRAQGLFVGSGVVEAGCKTVVGKRLKQSGMEWTVRGANAIIALRCCHLSGRTEEFWEQVAA
ncbi:ISKra4 family transposase [Candidatus Poribacteria bacterium]|nr:ISKra4 family transposase [Candidatus Poribacteria bacterium]